MLARMTPTSFVAGRHRMTLEPLYVSTALVAVAEMGDKTQLLAFALAARFRRRLSIVAGILLATFANHLLAGAVGSWLAQQISPMVMRWIIAVSFFAFGFWALKPDEFDQNADLDGNKVLFITIVAFFLVEMGDKTQLATVALAAKYQTLLQVVIGTTLGMLLANVPAVWIGEALSQRINMRIMRWVAAALFFTLGAISLLAL